MNDTEKKYAKDWLEMFRKEDKVETVAEDGSVTLPAFVYIKNDETPSSPGK